MRFTAAYPCGTIEHVQRKQLEEIYCVPGMRFKAVKPEAVNIIR
jgi:hypothetical protein